MAKIKSILLSLFFIGALDGIAQFPAKYIVYFTDKNASPYSVSAPSAYLSARAIQRRTNQGIAITSQDFPPNPSYVQQVIAAGAQLHHRSRWFNAATVTVPNATVLSTIQALTFVNSISKVTRIHQKGREINFEKGTNEQVQSLKTSSYNYGQAQTQITMLGGDCLHNLGYDGKNMVIAVFDAGFKNVNTLSAYDSIRNNNQLLGTFDFVNGDTLVFEDDSHGEMVLSCMAANIPGQMVGTAPKANYWLLRTEEGATELVIEEMNWIAAAEFADSVGADVINSSLGYTTFDVASQDHVYADLDGNTCLGTKGADLAASKGMFVCNSAGNSGSSSWYYIGVPADGDSVCAVGAVNSSEVIAGFSSRGPTADGRTKPNVCAMGQGSAVIHPTTGNVTFSSGTSFSSPILAGMVACLWQAHPGKSNMDILNTIQQASDKYNNPDNDYGHGIPDFCTAHQLLGGIIDANDLSEEGIIDLYPNPFNDYFNLKYYSKSSTVLKIEIYDVGGRLVFKEEKSMLPNTLVDLKLGMTSQLAAGSYMLSLRSENVKITRKLIKN